MDMYVIMCAKIFKACVHPSLTAKSPTTQRLSPSLWPAFPPFDSLPPVGFHSSKSAGILRRFLYWPTDLTRILFGTIFNQWGRYSRVLDILHHAIFFIITWTFASAVLVAAVSLRNTCKNSYIRIHTFTYKNTHILFSWYVLVNLKMFRNGLKWYPFCHCHVDETITVWTEELHINYCIIHYFLYLDILHRN